MFSPQKQNIFLNGGIIEKLLTVEDSAHFYPKSHYYTTASFVGSTNNSTQHKLQKTTTSL